MRWIAFFFNTPSPACPPACLPVVGWACTRARAPAGLRTAGPPVHLHSCAAPPLLRCSAAHPPSPLFSIARQGRAAGEPAHGAVPPEGRGEERRGRRRPCCARWPMSSPPAFCGLSPLRRRLASAPMLGTCVCMLHAMPPPLQANQRKKAILDFSGFVFEQVCLRFSQSILYYIYYIYYI